MPKRSFDADQQTRDLLEAEITIGGQTFHPARLTPDVRREQLLIATRSAKLAREVGLDQDQDSADLTPEKMDQRAEAVGEIDQGLYGQLAALLRNEKQESPTEEWLTEHLDNRVASRMLTWLLEDDEQGESQTATTPAATSS